MDKKVRFTMEQASGSKGLEQGARFYDCSSASARGMAKEYMRRYNIKACTLRWEEKDAYGEYKTISVIDLTNFFYKEQ